MNINDMTMEQIEARLAEINAGLETRSAEELEADRAEILALQTRKAEIEAFAEQRSAELAAAAEEVITTPIVEEVRTMTAMEIRRSPEYIEAFANYIKTGSAAECRALLTENTSDGTVAVPEMVYEIVKTAWDKEGIMSRVKKAYIQGNLKVGFERSASGATIHTEGANLDEETLTLGIVELVPQSIKKWISISDEAMDLRGEAFLRYIYEELAYQIAKKAADELVAKIVACTTQGFSTSPAVPAITATQVAMGTVAKALAQLSDEAANPIIIMNKQTWAEFKSVQYANGYGADPFEGLPVEFNSTIPAFATATTGVCYAIVGDLNQGALANFPNGEEITFKFDDKSLAEKDLVKIVAREFVGLGVVAPKAFCKINH